MKKGTLTFSGILTLFFSLILLGVSFLLLGTALNLEFLQNNEILIKIVTVASLIFVVPIRAILPDVEILKMVLPALLALYAIICFISSIMQLKNRKATVEKLVKAKKLNAFINIFRIIFCLVVAFFIVLNFVQLDFVQVDIKALSQEVATAFGFEYINLAVAGVLFLLGLLAFILPTVGYKKLIKSMQGEDSNVQNYNQNNGQYYNGQYYNGQNNEAQGYQEQYYAYNETQPINPNDLVSDQTQQGGLFNLVPGQDGIPSNITQKGLEDLARLERLHASGAIDENNYLALKQKICSTNLG